VESGMGSLSYLSDIVDYLFKSSTMAGISNLTITGRTEQRAIKS